jgi:membrane dipeptidase
MTSGVGDPLLANHQSSDKPLISISMDDVLRGILRFSQDIAGEAEPEFHRGNEGLGPATQPLKTWSTSPRIKNPLGVPGRLGSTQRGNPSVRCNPTLVQSLPMNTIDDEYLTRARELHQRAVVIDTHCDTTQRLADAQWDPSKRHDTGHVDIPRLREGGVDAVFFAVWKRGPVEAGKGSAAAREQIQRIYETVRRHDELVIARSAADVRKARDNGRIALLIAIEGGYLIEDSLDTLREYHRAGARCMTLTHAFHTSWADSSGVHEALEPLHGGLTDFGRAVVREMNRLGMIVDVSHASDDTFWDVISTSVAPVVATHSSCRTVSPHLRNLTDEMMKAIAATGGTVQINFCASFVDPEFPPIPREVLERLMKSEGACTGPITDHITPLSTLADHFEHALQLIGPNHVGIGSDFDGVPQLPEGMEDCSKLPYLTAELLRRGYREGELATVLGENVLRVMDRCEAAAQKLKNEERPKEPGATPSQP